jgi:hypothetical protein
MEAGSPPPLLIDVPTELENGTYANFLVIHATEHDFTLDFCVRSIGPPTDAPTVKVVSRIRISPGFLPEMLQAVSQNAFRRDEHMARLKREQDQQQPEGFDDPDQ